MPNHDHRRGQTRAQAQRASEQHQREVRRIEAEGWAANLLRNMGSGDIPSCLYQGQRVQVLKWQDHPKAGRRYSLKIGPLVMWVLAPEVSDLRGQAPESVVPPGLKFD